MRLQLHSAESISTPVWPADECWRDLSVLERGMKPVDVRLGRAGIMPFSRDWRVHPMKPSTSDDDVLLGCRCVAGGIVPNVVTESIRL